MKYTIHHIRNKWLGHIIFSPGDSYSNTKRLLFLLHLGLEGVTDVETDSKQRFVTFTVTPSNDRVLYVYAPSRHDIMAQLARRHFFGRTTKLYGK